MIEWDPDHPAKIFLTPELAKNVFLGFRPATYTLWKVWIDQSMESDVSHTDRHLLPRGTQKYSFFLSIVMVKKIWVDPACIIK